MGNCLVTKLNEVVQNENLPKLGRLILGKLNAGANTLFQLNGYADGEGVSVGMSGAGSSMEYKGSAVSNPFTLTLESKHGSNTRFYAGSENSLIYVDNKYDLAALFLANSNTNLELKVMFDDFYCLTKLYYLEIELLTSMYGSLNELCEQQIIYGRNYAVYPDLFVVANGVITYFNGSEIVTPTKSTCLYLKFKDGGYEIHAATAVDDTTGELLYDSTAV